MTSPANPHQSSRWGASDQLEALKGHFRTFYQDGIAVVQFWRKKCSSLRWDVPHFGDIMNVKEGIHGNLKDKFCSKSNHSRTRFQSNAMQTDYMDRQVWGQQLTSLSPLTHSWGSFSMKIIQICMFHVVSSPSNMEYEGFFSVATWLLPHHCSCVIQLHERSVFLFNLMCVIAFLFF